MTSILNNNELINNRIKKYNKEFINRYNFMNYNGKTIIDRRNKIKRLLDYHEKKRKIKDNNVDIESINKGISVPDYNFQIYVLRKKKKFFIREKWKYLTFLKKLKDEFTESDDFIDKEIQNGQIGKILFEIYNLNSEISKFKKYRIVFTDDPKRELNEKEKIVIKNYSKFYNIDEKDVKLSEIYKTSAGFKGWLNAKLEYDSS